MNTDDRQLAQPMKPMSAARLRAEAAFATPDTALTHAKQTPVVVKPLQVSPAVMDASTDAGHNPHDEANKAPRIFRIDPVNTAPKAPIPNAEPLPEAPTAKPKAVNRRRRTPERRPGQVVHILRAASPAAKPPTTPDPPLATLYAHLAPAGRLLEEAGSAQAFVIDGRLFENDWQALALRVNQLRQALLKRLR